jgi:hypothetical protein
MDIEKTPKNAENFYCNKCDFICIKKSDWNRHILRPKHLKNTKDIKKTPKNAKPECDGCGKIYKYNSGLWKHKKICIENKNIYDEHIIQSTNEEHMFQLLIKENTDFKNIILDVVKNNSELQKQTHELQKQMLEVCKNNGNNNGTTIINSNSHNNNKTFNLNVFLNEECKDAMNLTDFMNSVDGVSNIIIKRLRDMDVNKRPMHCSDAKREIMYIKEENKWEKEPFGNAKLKKAISIIENKNIKLLGEWKEAHPTWMEYDSPDNDICMNLIIQTMSNCDEVGDKVIKKLAKEVVIDK